MRHDARLTRDPAFDAFLWGEVLVFGLLGASLALFLSYAGLRTPYELPHLRLVITTAMALGGGLVAVLSATRFAVEGRRVDLLLCGGFLTTSLSWLAFTIGPAIAEVPEHRTEAWAGVAGRILGWALIAAAPFARGRVGHRRAVLGNFAIALALALALIWATSARLGVGLPNLNPNAHHSAVPFLLTSSLAIQALLNLLALVGFANRFRERGDDLDRWLVLGSTLMLFASIHFIFTPLVGPRFVSQGDFLGVLAYAVLLVGVWRAIRAAEFGRAVADERARVAREIHDGLAQYLFAVSTHASLLESGAARADTLARLKEAALAAQREARFAVLALSSAAGNAPFDATLRRYVELLTADGVLDVGLDIDPQIRLAPDEQIEIFRIVQEGLANVRKHANARTASVTIGEHLGERLVVVRDDGCGFATDEGGAGQGLRNIRQRAATIGGAFRLRSAPDRGTELEVVLRA
jgi:signal transduction histidine kinase